MPAGMIALVLALGAFSSAGANPDAVPEYAVKAAFLFNFARFAEWPRSVFPTPSAPFAICVVGRDPFGQTLDRAVAGRSVLEHPIEVRRIDGGGDASSCQIVFAADAGVARAVLASLPPRSALTVTENAPGSWSGAVINLTVDRNRVRFEVDLEAARRGGLKLSSKLLALAAAVKPVEAPRSSSR